VAAIVTVVQQQPAISGLVTTPASVTLSAGSTQQISATVSRASPTVALSVTYASSNASVASVSNSGVITANALGTAVITVTANGSGTGFATTSLTGLVAVTVTAPSACNTFTPASLETVISGTISTSDCAFLTSGRVDYYRLNVPTPRVVRMSMAASFTQAGLLGEIVGDRAFFWVVSGTTTSTVATNFFMPAGQIVVGALSNSALTGSYQLTATTQAEDVSECRQVILLGSITTSQNLTAQSCVAANGAFYDRFAVFAPGRACSIAMRRNTTSSPQFDPYVELWRWDGTSVFASNDDDANSLNSFISLTNCVDPTGNAIDLRVQELTGGTGTYDLVVTIAPLPPGAPSHPSAAIRLSPFGR
jgi:hypothetical protein